jgi:uncharacterized membrane protein YuzA (DUF378 family)
MKTYHKISPILMTIGFISLASGVFMSMSAWQTAAYILVGFGLILYVVGRIGIYFAPKKTRETEPEKEDGIETKENE